MTSVRALDVSELPDFEISSQSPLWWGQLCLCFIEGTMFSILIAMYFYYRLRLDVWPPPGTQLPHVLMPSVALVPLFISAVGSYISSEAAKQNQRGRMILGLVINVVFALAFLGFRIAEWNTLNFTWAADVHGSMVWTILGLHSLDAVADVLFTIALIVLLLRGYATPDQRIGVHVDSVVWYFLVLIWLPLYVVVYWGPRFVGAP